MSLGFPGGDAPRGVKKPLAPVQLSLNMRSLLIEFYGYNTPRRNTGLLGEAPVGVWRVFSHAGIDVENKTKVYLGFLRDADHNGRVRKAPFSTVDGLRVNRVSSSR